MNKAPGCGCGEPKMPLPPHHPYMMGGHYACDCCQTMYQPTIQASFPSSGSVVENLFLISNATPYLFDAENMRYGTKLSVSENVYTRISRRSDLSCINLAATIDLTEKLVTNTAMYAFLQQTIGSNFETLEQYLPVIKSRLRFKLYYTIKDQNGGVIYTSHMESVPKDGIFHYTDVKDYFLQSFHYVMITNIPAMDYAGIYTLCLDRMEVYASTVDTKNSVVDGFNPLYQFTDNNTKLVTHHDTIAASAPASEILIAARDLNYATEFQANLTTRLKVSYNAYMSNLIASSDVYGIWTSLYEPTEEIVQALKNTIQSLSEAVYAMQDKIDEQNAKIAEMEESFKDFYYTSEEYKKGHFFHKGVLTWIETGDVYQTTEAYTTTDDDDLTVAEAFAADIESGKLVPCTKDGANISELSDRVDTVEADMDVVKTTVYKQTDAITGLSDRVDTAESDIDKIETVIGTITSDISTVRSNIDTIESDVSGAKTTIDSHSEVIDGLIEGLSELKSDMDDMTTYTTFKKLGIDNDVVTYPTMLDLYKALDAKGIKTNTIITGMIYRTQLPSEFNNRGNAEISIQVIDTSFFCTCTSQTTSPYSWNALYGMDKEIFGWTPTWPTLNSSDDE